MKEPLVSSKGREDLSEHGGSYLSVDGSESQSQLTSKSKELQVIVTEISIILHEF